MRIYQVGVTYGELRSSGYPNFSNTRHEVTLRAALEEGETAAEVAIRLEAYAKAEVKRRFGDVPQVPASDMESPYRRPSQGERAGSINPKDF